MVPIPFIWVLICFFRALWRSLRTRSFRPSSSSSSRCSPPGLCFTVEGWIFLDSLYLSVITLITVGYEDFSLLTTAGKIFTML